MLLTYLVDAEKAAKQAIVFFTKFLHFEMAYVAVTLWSLRVLAEIMITCTGIHYRTHLSKVFLVVCMVLVC